MSLVIERPRLVYEVHSAKLNGTERMALDTCLALAGPFDPLLLAPSGQLHEEAARLGVESRVLEGRSAFARAFWDVFRRSPASVLITTRVQHALAAEFLARMCGRALRHFHVVHGGTDEAASYGNKHWLRRLGVRMAAVSDFVRGRLLAHGVQPHRVEVIENFLSEKRLTSLAEAPIPARAKVRRILTVGRLEAIKRCDLLLEAMAGIEDPEDVELVVVGDGTQRTDLESYADLLPARVRFIGWTDDVAGELRRSDLLVHPCPEEPFGLVVIEAMAAGLPVIVADAGGSASLVEEGVTGFHHRAGQAGDLRRVIEQVRHLDAEERARIGLLARRKVIERFGPVAGRDRWLDVLHAREGVAAA